MLLLGLLRSNIKALRDSRIPEPQVINLPPPMEKIGSFQRPALQKHTTHLYPQGLLSPESPPIQLRAPQRVKGVLRASLAPFQPCFFLPITALPSFPHHRLLKPVMGLASHRSCPNLNWGSSHRPLDWGTWSRHWCSNGSLCQSGGAHCPDAGGPASGSERPWAGTYEEFVLFTSSFTQQLHIKNLLCSRHCVRC